MVDPKKIKVLFKKLNASKSEKFPGFRQHWNFTTNHGVYIIYDSKNIVLHVGKSARGVHGLKQRLLNHLGNNSSFSIKYVTPKKINLREKCFFKYILISDPKERAYLENLATGLLCPAHIGTSEKVSD